MRNGKRAVFPARERDKNRSRPMGPGLGEGAGT